MDSTTRPDSQVFSPSLVKTSHQNIPKITTPSSRRYLRRSFPTFGTQLSTTPRSSPDDVFKQRQQQLQDAQVEKEQVHQQASHSVKQPISEQDDDASSMSSIIQHPGQAETTTTNGTATATELLSASAIHARQAQEVSERLAKLLQDTAARRAKVAAPSSNTSPTAPRLRTTETEYDFSPDRTRLSTPPRGLHSGMSTRPQRNIQEEEQLQESDGLASPVYMSSPSVRHSLSRQWLEQEKILQRNKELFQRHSDSLKDELANAAQRMSHCHTPVELENDDGEDLLDVTSQGLNQQQETTTVLENIRYDDDQGFDIVDEEVSFKRSTLASSSNHSTVVDPDALLRYDFDDEQEEAYLDLPPTPRVLVRPPEPRTSTPKDGYSSMTEKSLLEVAKKTAAITKELRGVYSNLRELFSPETEAKISGAMSVLSACKNVNGSQASNIRRMFDETVRPNPPVFEAFSPPSSSPPLPSTAIKSPMITRRKPAPLRSAVMPKIQRAPPLEQEQKHHQTLPSKEQSNKVHKHDVSMRGGLISNAESARRFHQSIKDPHSNLRRSLNGAQEVKGSFEQQSQLPPKIPTTLNFAAESPREKHQERFRRKLAGWKRAERQNQFEAPSLPTYSDLYIPVSSSRQPIYVDPKVQHVKHGQVQSQSQELEEGEEEEEEEVGYDIEAEEAYELQQPIREDANLSRKRILEDLRAQMTREEELRQRRVRRSEGFESDEELLNHRRLSKKRREAAFWS